MVNNYSYTALETTNSLLAGSPVHYSTYIRPLNTPITGQAKLSRIGGEQRVSAESRGFRRSRTKKAQL